MSQQATEQVHGHYIGGEWTTGDESTFESENPATGETLATFQRGTEADVDAALEAAESAVDEWRDLSYIDRAEYLWDIYHELRDRHEELGEIVTKECGKEISEGKADVTEAWHMVEWAAGNARHPHGDVVPSEVAGKDSYMRRKPRGVVGCITPWNFPVAIPFWHMAIALVEGNTVVWKPAEQTPWCGQIVAEMFEDAGIPDGVFNMIQGFGDAGAAITDDERVDTVLFTGSAEVGHEIADKVGGEPGKLAACEMGGKNGIVITEHADMDTAIHAAIMSSFKTTGQRCVSSERLIVHEDVYDEFKARFVDVAENIAVGDPLAEDTFMGPAIEADHVEKIRSYNDLAREEGANVLVDRFELEDSEIPDGHEGGAATAVPESQRDSVGTSEAHRASEDADGERSGSYANGHWVGPFVYEIDYDPDLRCLNEECFGPHVAVLEYSGDIERAVEMHNATPYGLAGAIISEDYRQLNYFRDHAEVGLAYANLPCIGAEVQLPFGGIKKSGNGYPSAREAIEAVTERTAWTMNNAEEIEMAQGLSADIKTSED
ncbi:aldehyde dehydrogenase (NAD+) [Natrinema hispanicum]|uniref:Aldehyde dehydrogenase (NAD+) n=1 Tax=Natrinema hispanicum TaxID=392421 RepID=A0A482Y8N0_9EURY|nr:aldehyde dehydrogenase family protein [Natrinema hispanicum]RZV08701.1 aldehyde dehydrogenase (NAD+) [Natrinema hispanicum]